MKKNLSIFMIIATLLLLVGCFAVEEVKSVTFTKAPEAEYEQYDDVDASEFTVQIVTSEKTYDFDLTDANITVQGLVNGKLDTSTPGTKSVTVTYRGVSATVYYKVTAGEVIVEKWIDSTVAPSVEDGVYIVDSAEKLAHISANSSNYLDATIKLTANIDLSGKLWVPIPTFGGTFDGQNFTISNMTTVNVGVNNGLFAELTGGSVSNLIIDNATVGSFSFTNSGALSGKSSGVLTIDNVTVTNANIKGLGAIGGLIGRAGSSPLTVTNSYVQGRLSTSNPVLSTFGDGEGDKVGGLVGQNLTGNKMIAISNTVNVIIEGTRDLGGIVGWTDTGEYKNNIVLAGTEIKANVAGGVRFQVGTRNVGAIAGTVALNAGNIIFKSNIVSPSVVLFVDTVYEPYSSSGIVFGGVRRDMNKAAYHVELNDVVLVGNDLLTSLHYETFTSSQALEALELFVTQQATYMDQVSEILAG